MINLFNHFKEIFFIAAQKIAAQNNIEILTRDFESFIVEPAKEKSHGDLACNIAMIFSKKFSAIESLNNPRKLATEIIKNINDESVIKLDIAGPGFINIFLQNQVFYNILGDLLQKNAFIFPNLGKNQLGEKEKINLEYASPNPTGPIHVGHTRGAIYGDVLASLLKKCGFDVLKEYYVNDAGGQIFLVLKSAYIRYLQDIGKYSYEKEMPEGFYPGEYLKPIGKKIAEEFGGETLFNEEFYKIDFIKPTQYTRTLDEIKQGLENGEKIRDLVVKNTDFLTSEKFLKYRDFVINEMVKLIVADLAALGIKHDNIFSEKKELHDTGKINEIIKSLEEKGVIYKGKLEAPKTEKGVGSLPEGYDEAEQTLFRSSEFGDDQDRVVKKADGTPTYFAADLAYIKSKFERGATKFIMPLGYDHAGYIKRLTAATEVITNGEAQLKIILCQMVKFVKNGEPLKMSKRAGNFIAASDLIDQLKDAIGGDKEEAKKTAASILRFIMLTRKNDTHFDFDLAKVIEQSKDNPIFYVQYAHARCCSVLRNLKAEGLLPNIESLPIDLAVLQNLRDENELEIIKKIVAFPRIIEMAVANYEPHRIAFYLQELAATFHSLWNKGVDNPDLKFIISDKLEFTKARIYLLMAIKIIISSGLDIFSIKALEEMR